MGIYSPVALAVADYVVAQKPLMGGEKKLFLSAKHATEIGQFQVAAVNSGLYTPDPVNLPDQTAGNHLIVVVDTRTGLDGGLNNVVVTVNGTNIAGAPISGTATIKPPPYARDTNKIFQVGYAADVVVAADAPFKTILSVSATVDATAVGSKIVLFAMPLLSTFKEVGCVTDFRFGTKSSTPVAIPCGMDGAAFSKPGRVPQPEVSFTADVFGFGDGLIKFDGITGTALVKDIKEGKIHTDNVYFLESTLKVSANQPDGEAVATFDATGTYEDAAYLVAY